MPEYDDTIPETYLEGIGTVRQCSGCGALVGGGPTSCAWCAEKGDPKTPWRKRIWFRIWYISWLRRFRWFGKLEDYLE